MRGGIQTFLALINAAFAASQLVAACLPGTTVGMFLLHVFGFALAASVGLHIWNDR